MKYVALAVASNIPKFYFSSLGLDNKMKKVNLKSVNITKRRTED